MTCVYIKHELKKKKSDTAAIKLKFAVENGICIRLLHKKLLFSWEGGVNHWWGRNEKLVCY